MGDPADTLKAMSDETRFRIVTILLNHDLCAGAIARRLGISDAAVSQHMRVLREAGLVTSERRGYFTHFSVDRDAIRELADFLQTMSGWERGPCDPDLEGCTAVRRGRCPAEKCGSGCPRAGGGRCPGCTMVTDKRRDETMTVAVTYENGAVFQLFERSHTRTERSSSISAGRSSSRSTTSRTGRSWPRRSSATRAAGMENSSECSGSWASRC